MKDIYTLTIKCVAGLYLEEEFSWVVEVPTDTTLSDLDRHIKDYTGYGDEHLSAFFTARNYWARKRAWLTDPDRESDWKNTLAQIYPLDAGQRLFYLYDFGDNWIFSIGKRAKSKAAQAENDYPNVIKETGKVADQYPDYEE